MSAYLTLLGARVAALAIVATLSAPAAGLSATASCVFDEPSRAVTLTIPSSAQGVLAIDALGRIVADESRTPCGGATRLNTASILVTGASGSGESVLVDTGLGPFLVAAEPTPPAPDPPTPPGPPPAIAAAAPIRLEIDLAGADQAAPDLVIVRGTPGDDRLGVDIGLASSARIRVTAVTQLVLDLDLRHADTTTIALEGGAGRDLLVGSPRPESLIGGPGDDTLDGAGGGDRYVFEAAIEPERDLVVLAPGPGSDELDLSAVPSATTVDLAAPAGVLATHTDRVIALSGAGAIEDVTTGAGSDTVVVNSLANVVSTGAGDDVVDLRGAGPDTAVCGAGVDLALLDADDRAAPDCEPPAVAPPPEPRPAAATPPPLAAAVPAAAPSRPLPARRPPPRRAPSVAIGGRALHMSRRGKVRVLVRCPSLAQGACRLDLELAAVRPIPVARGRPVVLLGVGSRSIAPGRTRSIVIALGPVRTRLVRRLGAVRVRLSVTVRDESLHARTTRKRFLLHAPTSS